MDTAIYLPTEENIKKCARLLAAGGLVAFPTETVYGLGANALMPDSVKMIYAAKGRPSDNPLIVHIASVKGIEEVAETIPDKARLFIEKFMPGPVTAVLPKRPIVPDCVTGGLKTVAVRMPSHPVAARLIAAAGVPVCAPSANISGLPSPTTAEHCYRDLAGKIPAILDGGACTVGVESTVVDFTVDPPRLLRAGGMPIEYIEEEIGRVETYSGGKVALCPGMKYKHYSPAAEVYVAPPGESELLLLAYDEMSEVGKRPVIVATSGFMQAAGGRAFYDAGAGAEDYARELFSLLRRADDDGYDTVLCMGTERRGMGAPLMNRLDKASGGKTLCRREKEERRR